MSRLTIYLSDDIETAFREACDTAELSYSEVVRELIVKELRTGELFDTVPDELVELAEKEARQERIMAKQTLREKRASFDDRVLGFFRKRLQGDAAYDPQDMRELADGYQEDAQNWFSDPDRIERKCDKVDTWMREYRAGFHARQVAYRPENEMDRSGEWFQIGQDIARLQDQQNDLMSAIRQKIKSGGEDPGDIIKSMADEFSVKQKAVEIVISQINPDLSRHELFVGERTQAALREINQTGQNLSDYDQPQIGEAEE